MNDLQLSGIAGLVTGGVMAAGGFIIEKMDTDSIFEKTMNAGTGYGLKLTGGITAAAGLALLGLGTAIGGGSDGGSGIFDAPGMP